MLNLTSEEIDLLESCVNVTEHEGYNVDREREIIKKLRESLSGP